MEFDLNKRICYWFNELCKIPHPSYHEDKVADMIVEFAKEHGFEWTRDDMHNVIVRKPGSKGCEDLPYFGLQAHTDMVAEANASANHNFLTDPLKLYVDDEGWLHAEGTTLGADDGKGVAYMLAILEDDTLKHPPLECIFTVQEEVGLIGAINLKKEDVKSHRIVSLDGGGEYATAISSAGGCIIDSIVNVSYEANSNNTYNLFITGLAGGHSGGEIHKEKGNSNKLMARILREAANKGLLYQLASINGGSKDNAIPRECTAVITTAASLEEVTDAVSKTVADIKTELEFSDAGFTLEVTAAEKAEKAMTAVDTKRVVDLMFLLPNGFRHRSMAIEGLTVTSLNMGVVRTNGDQVVITESIRSAMESGMTHLVDTIEATVPYFGATTKVYSYYPGWNYKEKSALRDTMNVAVKEFYGREIECHAGHGGCECGVFAVMYDDMDIVTFGPNASFIHTPDEKMDLASFDRAYKVLCRIMELCTE